MKANELRVGNLVNCIESNRTVEIASIMQSERDIFDFEVKDKDGMFSHVEDRIEPIPLTEEWAIKMKDNKHKAPFPDWIKYVHEAQNWYYWTYNKEELTIN